MSFRWSFVFMYVSLWIWCFVLYLLFIFAFCLRNIIKTTIENFHIFPIWISHQILFNLFSMQWIFDDLTHVNKAQLLFCTVYCSFSFFRLLFMFLLPVLFCFVFASFFVLDAFPLLFVSRCLVNMSSIKQ